MKKEKNFRILNSIGDVDERYILEASPFEEKKKKRSPRRLMLTAACIATLVMTLSLWLFIPFSVEKQEDVSRYRDSEYYEIIEKLNSFKSRRREWLRCRRMPNRRRRVSPALIW